jgi:hypothetical protein
MELGIVFATVHKPFGVLSKSCSPKTVLDYIQSFLSNCHKYLTEFRISKNLYICANGFRA